MKWTVPIASAVLRIVVWGVLTAFWVVAAVVAAIQHDLSHVIAALVAACVFAAFLWIAARRLGRLSRGDHSRDRVASAVFLGVVGAVLLLLVALELWRR